MSTARVGSNEKYAQGWEKVFGGKKAAKKRPAAKASPKKKTAKKRAKR